MRTEVIANSLRFKGYTVEEIDKNATSFSKKYAVYQHTPVGRVKILVGDDGSFNGHESANLEEKAVVSNTPTPTTPPPIPPTGQKF